MRLLQARFHIGQLICHRMFNYWGVVLDVDPMFLGSDAWYDQVVRSRPPKDKPWYRVLVHEAEHQTYVAERNLEPGTRPELRSGIPSWRPSSPTRTPPATGCVFGTIDRE